MRAIQIDSKGEIAIATVQRPDSLNALNSLLLNELLDALLAAKKDNCRAFILTGSGDKAFIAGADIKEIAAFSPQEMLQFCELGLKVADALEQAPFVTIAAVNGYAFGGGLEMALACDFIYAADAALFAMPEIHLGVLPGFGGAQRLIRSIGIRMTKELMMTGRHFKAKEAYEWGLINKICAKEELMDACLKTAKETCRHTPRVLQLIKKAIGLGMESSLSAGIALESSLCALCFQTHEQQAAMDAFLHKSKS